jgi:hypothetical protein
MKRTVDYAGNLGADWALFFPATNLPSTEMDRIVRQNGWLVDPDMDFRYYFYRTNIRTPEFDPDYVMNLREQANREINFENNYNMGMGNYQRAVDDFSEISNLYPNLQMAQDALESARRGLNGL